jgi:hypothetical protein
MERIEERIFTVRGQRVMLDADLAAVYGVLTRNLNKAVKRNRDRFPDDFVFLLTRQEVANLKFQFGTSSLEHGGRRKPTWVFTEHGAIMAANVLNSKRAACGQTVRPSLPHESDRPRRHDHLADLHDVTPILSLCGVFGVMTK